VEEEEIRRPLGRLVDQYGGLFGPFGIRRPPLGLGVAFGSVSDSREAWRHNTTLLAHGDGEHVGCLSSLMRSSCFKVSTEVRPRSRQEHMFEDGPFQILIVLSGLVSYDSDVSFIFLFCMGCGVVHSALLGNHLFPPSTYCLDQEPSVKDMHAIWSIMTCCEWLQGYQRCRARLSRAAFS